MAADLRLAAGDPGRAPAALLNHATAVGGVRGAGRELLGGAPGPKALVDAEEAGERLSILIIELPR